MIFSCKPNLILVLDTLNQGLINGEWTIQWFHQRQLNGYATGRGLKGNHEIYGWNPWKILKLLKAHTSNCIILDSKLVAPPLFKPKKKEELHDTDTKPILISFHKRIWHNIFYARSIWPPPTNLPPMFWWMIVANSTDCKSNTMKNLHGFHLCGYFLFNPRFFRLPQTIPCGGVKFQDKTRQHLGLFMVRGWKKTISKHPTSIWSIRISSCHHPTWRDGYRWLRWVAKLRLRGPFRGFWKHGNGTKLQLSYLIRLPNSAAIQKFKDYFANLIEFAWFHLALKTCVAYVATKKHIQYQQKKHSKRLCTVTWKFFIPHMLHGTGKFTYFGKNNMVWM